MTAADTATVGPWETEAMVRAASEDREEMFRYLIEENDRLSAELKETKQRVESMNRTLDDALNDSGVYNP